MQHTQEQVESSRDQFRKKLINLAGEQIFHDLNAYERKIVHEVAEEFGYFHVTSEDKTMITVSALKKVIADESENSEHEIEVEKKKKKKKNKKEKEKEKEENSQNEKVPQNMKDLIGDQSSEDENQGGNKGKNNKQQQIKM